MNSFYYNFLIFFALLNQFSNCFWLDQKTTEKGISRHFNKEKLNDVQKMGEIGIREIRWGNSVIKVLYNKKSQNKKPTEMSQEEVAKLEEERAEVKKLMAEYRRKMEPELAKQAKKLEKDEAFKKALRDIEAARAKHPEERRKTVPPSIPEINAKNGSHGDIELSLEQAKFLLVNAPTTVAARHASSTSTAASNDDSPPNKPNRVSRPKRGLTHRAQRFPNKKWPLDVSFSAGVTIYVPFSFDETISYKMKAMIYAAVQWWNDNTCLTIVEDGGASPRIQFTSVVDQGCKSEGVGMQAQRTYQHIWLEDTGCDRVGIIAHEVAHALGLVHEHQRPDRDSSVWYYPRNTDPESLSDFEKKLSRDFDTHNVPYDLGSLMHYAAKNFAINEGHTLVPKAGTPFLNTIGQRIRPSQSDYMVLNKYYCGLELYRDGSSINTVTCPTKILCDNDGFQNPKDCWECICPPGYIGKKCQDVDTAGYAPAGIPNTCTGEILFATSFWQNLVGRVGTDQLLVEENTEYAYCHWQIMADHGKTIIIQVLVVGVVCSDGCQTGNTEIRTETNRGATGIRLCCESDLGPNRQLSISAPNGYAMISLYSYHLIQHFFLQYRQV